MLGGHSILISLAVALHSRGFQASEGRCVWQSGGAGRGQVSQDLSELLARAPALLPGGPLANQVSCLVSTGVSWDNSFPSVTREPPLKPWKGSPFLQKGDTQYQTAIRKARTVGGEFGEEWIHVYE